MNNSSKKNQLVMAILVIIIGLYFVFIAPGQINSTSDELMLKITNLGDEFNASALTRLYVGSIWMGVLIMAGVTLISISYPLYQGKEWAWPVALVSLAIAPIGAFYTGLQYFLKFGFPDVWIVFIIGLLTFWSLILLKENTKKVKTVLFVILTLVGMMGTFAVKFFEPAIVNLLKSPKAAISDPTVMILRQSGSIMFILIFLSLISIYLLAKRKEAGWWISLISSISLAFSAFTVQFIRPSDTMFTYWMLGTVGIILAVLLLTPYFKNVLTLQPINETINITSDKKEFSQ